MSANPNRTAALILAGIALSEGAAVVWMAAANGSRFVRYLGFAAGRSGAAVGWLAAAVVIILFVGFAARLPSVRLNLWRPSLLKLLAIAVAISAGILEEAVFRKTLMDAAMRRQLGDAAQIALSALAFGAAHGIWGLFGRSLRAAAGATIATAVLGGALGLVYVLGGRSLTPCIAAHLTINLLIEPGLVLAATRGEMGVTRATQS